MRCFIAVEVDDETIKDKIRKVQSTFESIGVKVKNVEPENLHLTLKFLGEISEVQVEEVIDSLKELTFTPFNLRFNGVGVFPNLRRPRVVWVGTSEGASEMSELAKKVNSRLRKAGFQSEKRMFKPHLTIARVKFGGGAALEKPITSQKLTDFGVIKVESVKLKKSDLTPKGPIYMTLQTWRASED